MALQYFHLLFLLFTTCCSILVQSLLFVYCSPMRHIIDLKEQIWSSFHPIAIGYLRRRLASECVNAFTLNQVSNYFDQRSLESVPMADAMHQYM